MNGELVSEKLVFFFKCSFQKDRFKCKHHGCNKTEEKDYKFGRHQIYPANKNSLQNI